MPSSLAEVLEKPRRRNDSWGCPPPTDRIVVEYTAERLLSINHQAVLMDELEGRLRHVFDRRTDKTVFIAAAGTLRYGDVVQVIDAAKGAGILRVGVITDGMRRAAGLRP